MFHITVNVSDLLAKIGSLTTADLIRDVANAIADEAVIPELAKEPFRTPKKMIFKSAKQRAFVMAGIRSGALQVPYQRTGRIGETQKSASASGVEVVVPVGYSDLVRTRGQQAAYHQGTWPTTDDIAEKIEGGTAEAIGTAKVIEVLEKAGLS